MKKFLCLLLVLSCILAGCGAAAKDDSAAGMDSNAEMESTKDSGDVMNYGSSSSKGEVSENVSTNRKIIEKVYLDVETKEFDDLLEKLNREIEKVGGYVERSSVSGNSYSYEGSRYADYTIRIPSEKSDSFSEFVSANSTVTNKEITTDDVTLSYVDMESRVSALSTEKAALEKLLAEAEKLEDIITIQDRLTDVIYEIESYESQLRTYDNLIEYTTISVYIREVEKVTLLEEQTVWEEIKMKFFDNFENVGDGLVEIFVFIVSSIPYIIIIAGIIVVVLLVRRKIKGKSKE